MGTPPPPRHKLGRTTKECDVNYNDMMRNVAGSTGFTRKQADEAVVTTLTVLAETISAEETRDLLAQLPKSIRERVPVSGTTLEMRPIEFLARVADLTANATDVDTETRVRAVFSVLNLAVNSGKMNDIAEELGGAYADLLDRSDRLERAEARERAQAAAEARREAVRAILEEAEPVMTSGMAEPATTFGEPSPDPGGSVLDFVVSVPAALAQVVVAVLRRPVRTGMDLVALVRHR